MSSDKITKIQASMIIEVLGRPPEHLIETLEDFAKKISEEKGVVVLNKKIMEPNLVKDQKDIYSTFMEIEFEAETVMHLAGLMFRYMPAHIEVISPESLVMKNNSCSEILSEIVRRLHRYDEIARILESQNIILQNKIKELSATKPAQKIETSEIKETNSNTKKVKKKK